MKYTHESKELNALLGKKVKLYGYTIKQKLPFGD